MVFDEVFLYKDCNIELCDAPNFTKFIIVVVARVVVPTLEIISEVLELF